SSAKAENLRNGNPALPHRFRRALHQQPGRTGPQDDEGQNENLRLISNPRRRSNLRPPQIRRLDREKTRPQHPPNPHRKPVSDHESPRRIAGSLGVTDAKAKRNRDSNREEIRPYQAEAEKPFSAGAESGAGRGTKGHPAIDLVGNDLLARGDEVDGEGGLQE